VKEVTVSLLRRDGKPAGKNTLASRSCGSR